MKRQMVNIAPRHVFAPSPQLMVAFLGLEGDVQSLSQELSKQVASKLGRGLGFMNENRRQRPIISPRSMASLTSHVFVQPKTSPMSRGTSGCRVDRSRQPKTIRGNRRKRQQRQRRRREPHPVSLFQGRDSWCQTRITGICLSRSCVQFHVWNCRGTMETRLDARRIGSSVWQCLLECSRTRLSQWVWGNPVSHHARRHHRT
jgi:hypothetical protein